jgi:hypothetical protein
MLLRMFERRLRGYRAIGYAREQTPLGFAEARDEVGVEGDAGRDPAADVFDFS